MNSTNVRIALIAIATILPAVLLSLFIRFTLSQWLDQQLQQKPQQPQQQPQGLRQIYPDKSDAKSEFDIIAIHGLDTTSVHTWTWRDRNSKNLDVDWLRDPSMLPTEFPIARIFTYDWPAEMFKSNSTIELTTKSLARRLLHDVLNRDSPNPSSEERPILFIASCLGGLILIEALATAATSDENNYKRVWNATGGIIFLATPFRGTSFERIVSGVNPFLRARATLTATVVTELLNNVRESTSYLQDLVSNFTAIYHKRGRHCQLQIFYETKKSNPLRKALPSWLADIINRPKLLVDSDSARLHIVAHPIALERTHVLMNKFPSSECPDYKRVIGEINSIRLNFRLDVDIEILKQSYTDEILQVERLSGKFLDMDKCYINLAIMNQDGIELNNAREQNSHLSLLSRLRAQQPDEKLHVILSRLFDERKGLANLKERPRRILIRGRAGVGKTTLCKKIVYGFKNGTLWPGLFDRLLWIPLRNLKQKDRQIAGYSYGHLFHHEYFSHHGESKALGQELWERVKTRDGKTLFLLDGLDEVLQGWESSSDVFRFIGELLNWDDVIITSRPYGTLYPNMHPVDLELETIGFYPDQVQDYLRMSFQNAKKLAGIQLFLREHPLLLGLFRIPIQLDAFCYTWEDVAEKKAPKSMTAVYQAVEVGLWRKDYYRFKGLTSGSIPTPSPKKMETIFMKEELVLLEVLAFAGLYNDVVTYESIHQDIMAELEEYKAVINKRKCSLYEVLACASFLRTPNSTSSPDSRVYHFIHLTFQEYFAARYFMRQWEAGKPLNCRTFDDQHIENYEPIAFLQRHKYNARYDIMWRFVAGLLASKPKSNPELIYFFDTINKEPRDLFGPVHHRLNMHCLYEVTQEGEPEDFTPLRAEIESQLHHWLPREDAYAYGGDSWIAKEIEFPHRVINNMLEEAPKVERRRSLSALSARNIIHPDTTNLICRWLRDNTSQLSKTTLLRLIGNGHTVFLKEPVQLVTDFIKDDEADVRAAAIRSLRSWPDLPGPVVQVIAGRLDDADEDVRVAAVEALGGQSTLPDQVIQSIAGRIKNDTLVDVKLVAVHALVKQPYPPEQVIQIIADWLAEEPCWHWDDIMLVSLSRWPKLYNHAIQVLTDRIEHDTEDMRGDAVKILGTQPELPTKMVELIARQLEDDDEQVRIEAIRALVNQPDLPDQVIELIADRLKDTDSRLVLEALDNLIRRPKLQEKVVQLIVNRFDNMGETVRRRTVTTLGHLPSMPEQVLRLIAGRLDNINPHLRSEALHALGLQPNLPDHIIQLIAGRLDDADANIRSKAAVALGRQSHLPDQVIQLIAGLLDDVYYHVRGNAVYALRSQSNLPDQVIQLIAGRLDDTDANIRSKAAVALGRQPNLSYQVIKLIADQFDDVDPDVRRKAGVALGSQPNLPDQVIQSIAGRLDNIDVDVRRSATDALRSQSNLTEHVIQLIADRLDDSDSYVKDHAVIKLLPLCDKIPQKHIKSFHRELLERSFDEHICWVIHGSISYIIDGAREIPFHGDLDHLKSELGLLEPQQQESENNSVPTPRV